MTDSRDGGGKFNYILINIFVLIALLGCKGDYHRTYYETSDD